MVLPSQWKFSMQIFEEMAANLKKTIFKISKFSWELALPHNPCDDISSMPFSSPHRVMTVTWHPQSAAIQVFIMETSTFFQSFCENIITNLISICLNIRHNYLQHETFRTSRTLYCYNIYLAPKATFLCGAVFLYFFSFTYSQCAGIQFLLFVFFLAVFSIFPL